MAEFGRNVEDLVEQILLIAPPKTLMRFKCVSKRWYALIKDPRFIAKHISNSNHNNPYTTCVLLKRFVNEDTNPNEPLEVFSLLKFRKDDPNNYEIGVDEHEIGFDVEDINIPAPIDLRDEGSSLHIVGNCNEIICLVQNISRGLILWNPATQEFKTLPPQPYLPPYVVIRTVGWSKDFPYDYMDSLGFGYDPKSDDYKVINIGFRDQILEQSPHQSVLNLPPKTAVYSLSTDSWREMKTYNLETQITILCPEKFHMCFNGICYWSGQELHKELDVYESMDEESKNIIIFFDTAGDEAFHYMLLPDCLYGYNEVSFNFRLLVWNESIALFAELTTHEYAVSAVGIWVMDGPPNGAWAKHITFDLRERPLTFLNSDEILMLENSFDGYIFSYNLVTRRPKYFHNLQRVPYFKVAVCGNYSIAPLLAGYSLAEHTYSPSPSPSTADYVGYSYSVWAMPPDDVSCRIKKVMEGLRSEFGGPEIEPHIPVVASIRMTHEAALDKFRSLHSWVTSRHIAKVSRVATRPFYYQCVSLPIDTESAELLFAIRKCIQLFGFPNHKLPHLSLLYGNLTEEGEKKALEKVRILDESITSMSFPLTRLALYKVDYTDKSLASWEKIAEYTHQDFN